MDISELLLGKLKKRPKIAPGTKNNAEKDSGAAQENKQRSFL